MDHAAEHSYAQPSTDPRLSAVVRRPWFPGLAQREMFMQPVVQSIPERRVRFGRVEEIGGHAAGWEALHDTKALNRRGVIAVVMVSFL